MIVILAICIAVIVGIGLSVTLVQLSQKEGALLFWKNPTEAQIALQIELMRKDLVYLWKNDGYKEDREKYLEQYCKCFDEKGHGFHTFIFKLDKGLKITVNRFELLDYFNNTIFPSPQISDELKAEWKKAAIESWILIEQ
ncbi:MAG: hypothetical protein PUB52_11565 [Lachnospiraceae bacterium]|nr:hypothetical protein [Lachnospiraceae bacterium]